MENNYNTNLKSTFLPVEKVNRLNNYFLNISRCTFPNFIFSLDSSDYKTILIERDSIDKYKELLENNHYKDLDNYIIELIQNALGVRSCKGTKLRFFSNFDEITLKKYKLEVNDITL